MCKVREPQEGKELQIKRALIDGRAYDTEAAEEILRFPKQVNLGPLFCGDGQVWTCREFILYRTARGEFFEFDGEADQEGSPGHHAGDGPRQLRAAVLGSVRSRWLVHSPKT